MLNKMNLTSQIYIELSGKYPNMRSRSAKVYSIQHYVINFVSDLRKVGVFHRLLQFPPSIKLTDRHDITEILLKVQ